MDVVNLRRTTNKYNKEKLSVKSKSILKKIGTSSERLISTYNFNTQTNTLDITGKLHPEVESSFPSLIIEDLDYTAVKNEVIKTGTEHSMEVGLLEQMKASSHQIDTYAIEKNFVVKIERDSEDKCNQESIHSADIDLIEHNIKEETLSNNKFFREENNLNNVHSVKTDTIVNVQINSERVNVSNNVVEVDVKPNISEVLLDEFKHRITDPFVGNLKQKQCVSNTAAVKSELQYADHTESSEAGRLQSSNILLTSRLRSPINKCIDQSGFVFDIVSTNTAKRDPVYHTSKTSKQTKKVIVERNIYTYNSNIGNNDIKSYGENSEQKAELSCSKCCYKTQDNTFLELHALVHENNDEICIFSCTICDFITKEKELFTKHLINHNGKTPYKCFLCKFKFEAPSILIKHVKSNHPGITKPFSCNVCEYKSAHNSDVIRHTRIHTGEKPFSCKQCPYICKDISSLGVHMRTHTGEKPYSCKLCEYRSKCHSALVSHMRRHTGERPYTCKSCDYKFANNSDLVRHIKVNTGDNYSCNICEFNTSAKCALIKHLNTHNDVKVFNCALCNFECSRHCYLLKHMKKHNGKDVYKCNNCEFICDTYVKYTRHIVKHTGEISFSCNMGNCVCKGKQSLAKHIKAHIVEKNFFCRKCNFKCYRKCDLLVHKKTHVDEKPFHCAHCEYMCKSRRTLLRHVQKIHAGKSEVEFII